MEILRKDEKRTVLAALDDSVDGDDFCARIADDYNIVRTGSARECLEIMHERVADLSAVVIDIDMAEADDFAFLHASSKDNLFDTIPILIASKRELQAEDMRCLEEGALDFIMGPYIPELTRRRIDNAIRIKRSTTFFEIEAMLRELPSNIFLKDAEGRYVFATHYWHHLDTENDPNWSIRGKTDLEIRKDRENAIKAMEADKEIIRTGKGTSYVIEINVDGIQEFMELIKRPVFDKDGNVNGIIALINDVTEAELLKRELEKRARTDELTGLLNRRSFDECLRGIPRRDDFPIAIISADCDELKLVNDTYGHLVGDEYIHMAAMLLRVNIPEEAEAFRTGGDEFIALLPHTTEEQATEIVETIQSRGSLFTLRDHDIEISFGTAVIDGPNDEILEALAHADRCMYANKTARKLARKA